MKRGSYYSEELELTLINILNTLNDIKDVHYSLKLKNDKDWTIPLLLTADRIRKIAANNQVEIIGVFSLTNSCEYTITVDKGKVTEVLRSKDCDHLTE